MNFTWAYDNGHWRPPSAVSIALDDRGWTHGAIAVERLRTYGGKLRFVDEYLTRLTETLRVIGLTAAVPNIGFDDVLQTLIDRNAIPQDGTEDVSVVLLVTPGRPAAGPTVIAHLMELPWARIAELTRQGQSLVVSDVQQVAPQSWPRSIKVRSRLHYYLADLQAQARQSGAEALLVDQDGSVTETGSGNLLVLQNDGGWLLPPPDRVLPGITQKMLVAQLREAGESIEYRPIQRADLFAAREVVLTGTTAGVWPVVEIDGHRIGSGAPGPKLRELQRQWSTLLGIDLGAQAFSRWTAAARSS